MEEHASRGTANVLCIHGGARGDPPGVICALVSVVSCSVGSDWPQWGGATRAFEAADSVPLVPWTEAGPRLLWQRDLGPGNSGVAVADGLVVTAFRSGSDEVLAAYEQATGKERWRHVAPAPLPATLQRIEPRPGSGFEVTLLWTSRRLGSQVHNIVLAGDVVIGANESATFCGLGLADGTAVFRERSLADSNVLRSGASLVTLATDGELALATLDPEGPRVRSRQRVLSGRVWAAPALVDGVLYARDDRRLVAIELRDPRHDP